MQPGSGQPSPAEAGWPLRVLLDLGTLPTAAGCARAWARVILREWGLAKLADAAEIIVSELVTNSVLASRRLDQAVIRLILTSDHQQFVVLVHDFDPSIPVFREAGADDESGRGLLLVRSMSDRSGWYQPSDAPGKVVWAALSS